MTLLEILTAHQKASTGMSGNTPDVCKCGERVAPDWPKSFVRGEIVHYSPSEGRDKAFALHQLAQIREELT